MKLCALCALCGVLAACSSVTAPKVSEIGSAVGGSYVNPKGEQYSGEASSYVKFATANPGNDGKEVRPLSK